MILTILVMYFVRLTNRDQMIFHQIPKEFPFSFHEFFLAVVIPNILFKNKLT